MTRPSPWLILVISGLLVSQAPAQGLEPGFTPMFDGKSLAGWSQAGGSATYKVEGNEVVGIVDPASKSNSFLRTERNYGDFILKLDLKLEVAGNSGIQFRSHVREAKEPGGRVFGYQCEVDPSSRSWTGGLYDEARRAWLYPLDGHDEAKKAFKLKDWNSFVIEARGPSIKTTVNGVLCTDYLDTMDLDGFIALQVHTGKEGVIRFRDVRIKDLGRSTFAPLCDSKTLDGWQPVGGGTWTIKDGVIEGKHTASEPRHGHLFTKQTYGDFAARLKFKSIAGNSGLYFRVEEGGSLGVVGFQAEIDPTNDVGGLYETEGRGWVVQPKPADVKKWLKPNAWNDLSVVAIGDRVVVHVNGVKTAEINHDPGRKAGKFALQLHGGQDVDVQFKDLEILTVPEVKGSP